MMQTIAEFVRARANDDNTALLHGDSCWSYREFVALCAQRADWLLANRREGPFHVGIPLDNVPEFPFWIGACALAGATMVGINSTRRGADLERDINHSECQLIVTDDAWLHALDGLRLDCGDDRILDCAGSACRAMLEPHAGAPLPMVEVAPADTFMLIFTSGSSGAPKACICSHGRVARLTQTIAAHCGHGPDTVSYVTMPWFHAGAINTGWLQGSAPCFGGVAGDMTGRGQYKVWSDARIRADGKARWHSVGCTPRLLLAHGLQRISPPFTVTASQQLNLHTLDQRPALATLAATGLLDTTPLAQLRLAVLHGDDPDNDTALLPIPLIAVNPDGSVTVARQLQPGERVCWARQSPALSEPALAARLAAYRQRHGPPDFALLFSCASRGPQCWNGQDRDWQQLRHAFPATPLLGMYGNGQFAPAAGANRLLDGALLLALFHGEDDV